MIEVNEMSNIIKTHIEYNLKTGKLKGEEIQKSSRRLEDVKHIFLNQKMVEDMDPNTKIYEVETYLPVEEGKEGGLFFGTSYVYPGKVDHEFFMTKGHFHAKKDTAEYYWCIEGQGVLLLMDEEENIEAQMLEKGSLHYIPGCVAHRIANTGENMLVVGACWPSDAGHDYKTIEKKGFSVSVVEEDGEIVIRERES